KILGRPRYIVAPMVDQSEYAWRILSRRYGAHLCYTPMLHAKIFSENQNLSFQFCANDPQALLAAAKLVENDCDAVDINLGCPQHIAKRGHYGAFLMEEWDLIADMVRLLDKELAIPVTCKIRVYPDVAKTIEYAKMLESAGCQLLTIRRVKESVSIPVFANGNILYKENVEECIKATGVDGVMTAEGNLYNPALFAGEHPAVWRMAEEYLHICRDFPGSADTSAIRAHLFKIFAPCLNEHPDLRTRLAATIHLPDFEDLVQQFKSRITSTVGDHPAYNPGTWELDARGFRVLPSWVCQPHFRPELPTAESRVADLDAAAAAASTAEAGVDGGDATELTEEQKERNRKREERKELKRKSREAQAEKLAAKKARMNEGGKNSLCQHPTCGQARSVKCPFGMCKSCCRGRKWEGVAEFDAVISEAVAKTAQPSPVVPMAPDGEAQPPAQQHYLCEAHKVTTAVVAAV
ncbi:tRNA-dihydrouridine synthase 1-like protein, partial [Zopfochytrium polystomum]